MNKINDEFLEWLKKTYGNSKTGQVKAKRGKLHDYLGVKLDYSTPGEVKVEMIDYIKSMIKDFPEEIGNKVMNTPWSEGLFKISGKGKNLTPELQGIFHTIVAKGLFVTKRARQDIQSGIAFFLCSPGTNRGRLEKTPKIDLFSQYHQT
jgi:hypothetical protein